MRILREIVDLLKHLVWAVVMGVLIEVFSRWLPIWLSIFVALVLVALLAWAAWRWLGWTIWRSRKK
jgi:hypothetical protein